jgi:hypothetical protein
LTPQAKNIARHALAEIIRIERRHGARTFIGLLDVAMPLRIRMAGGGGARGVVRRWGQQVIRDAMPGRIRLTWL